MGTWCIVGESTKVLLKLTLYNPNENGMILHVPIGFDEERVFLKPEAFSSVSSKSKKL